MQVRITNTETVQDSMLLNIKPLNVESYCCCDVMDVPKMSVKKSFIEIPTAS